MHEPINTYLRAGAAVATTAFGSERFPHLKYPAEKSGHGREQNHEVVGGHKERSLVEGHHFFRQLPSADTSTNVWSPYGSEGGGARTSNLKALNTGGR